MEKEDLKLQCVRLATDIIGPHPSTTYVKANKKNFADDVMETAKTIFEWASGRSEEPKMVDKMAGEPLLGRVVEPPTIPPPPSPPLDKRYASHVKP